MRDSPVSKTFPRPDPPPQRAPRADRSDPASAQPRPLSSTRFDQVLHYRIQSRLGEGGMGVVYEALDQRLNRRVALKFLPIQVDRSSSDLQRLSQEANALSALNHPHIATLYALETVDEQQFLVLEHLGGGTLKTKVRATYASGGELPIDEILRCAQQTAEGLAHAHARGIVHRDVKTSNLMLTEEGDVKITDFGVAKMTGSSLKTVPGSLLGTIAYMSPEQALGLEVDARSDVFSLGVVLFELSTGRLPFEASNEAALLTKVANASAPKLTAFRPDAPPELERIVDRALKKRLEERYGTMSEMVADIRAARTRHFDQTRSIGRGESPRKDIPQPSGRAVALAIVGVLMVLFAAIFAARTKLFPLVPARQAAVSRPASETAASVHAANRLAVIPFTMVGRSEGNEGFHEQLMSGFTKQLSNLEQLRGAIAIVSPSEVRRKNIANPEEAIAVLQGIFADSGKDGPNLVLTGTVIEEDGSIVTASLHDVQRHIVLNSVDFEMATFDTLSKRLTEMLQLQLSETPDARQNVLRGRGYLERYDRMDNLKAAIAAFDRALSEEESYVPARAGRAETYLRMYDHTPEESFLDHAREDVRAAWTTGARAGKVYFAKGLLRVALGDYEGAIESFKLSLSIEGTADATRELAKAYDALDRLELAEELYRRAIQMRRGNWVAYKDLGVFYQAHGRLLEALPYFQRVVQLAPDDYSSYTNLGGLYSKLKRYGEAAASYQLALRIDPSSRAYYALGTSLFMNHRYPDAVDAYEKAVALNPSEGLYWGALGDACRWVPGMADRALDAYSRAVALKESELSSRPRDARIRAKIASWSTLTDKRKALRQIREAQRLQPRDARVQAQAASVYEQLGMRKEALSALTEAFSFGFAVAELQNWPILEKLRQDPRYKRIVSMSVEDLSVTSSTK